MNPPNAFPPQEEAPTIPPNATPTSQSAQPYSHKPPQPKKEKQTNKTHRPLRNRLNLPPHKLLQLIRTLRIRRRLIIILAAIIKHELRIPDEILRQRVQILLVLLLHRAQIHRLFDHLVIVSDFVAVDGLRKGP